MSWLCSSWKTKQWRNFFSIRAPLLPLSSLLVNFLRDVEEQLAQHAPDMRQLNIALLVESYGRLHLVAQQFGNVADLLARYVQIDELCPGNHLLF